MSTYKGVAFAENHEAAEYCAVMFGCGVIVREDNHPVHGKIASFQILPPAILRERAKLFEQLAEDAEALGAPNVAAAQAETMAVLAGEIVARMAPVPNGGAS